MRVRWSSTPNPSSPQAPPAEPPAELERWAERIVDGALRMDGEAISRALDEAFAATSVEQVVSGLIPPTAREIGDLWMTGRCSVANEHLASGIFVHRLRKLVEAAEPRRSEWKPVIVACFPDEYHQLGALTAAYWLCRYGLRVSFLGPALPFDDLQSAWSVLEPSATLLSVTRPAVYKLHRNGFRRLISAIPNGMLLYIGGYGVPKNDPRAEKAGAHLTPAGRSVSDVISQIVEQVQEDGRRNFPPRRSGAENWR